MQFTLLAAQKTFPRQLTILCERLLQQMFSDNIPHYIHPSHNSDVFLRRKHPHVSPKFPLTAERSLELYHDCFGQKLAVTVNTSLFLFWWSSVPVAVTARGIQYILRGLPQSIQTKVRIFSYNPPPPRISLLRMRQLRKRKIYVTVEELLLPIQKTFAQSNRSLHATRNASRVQTF